MPVTVRYHFKISLAAPASVAYRWCTDFVSGPVDHALMGDETGTRKIKQINKDTLILTDIFKTETGKVEKQKLIMLYPDQLSWNSTRISGPAKYSQFTYQITADGECASHLDFTGAFLDWTHKKLSKAEKAALSNRLCREDNEAWKLLAKAMKKDLAK